MPKNKKQTLKTEQQEEFSLLTHDGKVVSKTKLKPIKEAKKVRLLEKEETTNHVQVSVKYNQKSKYKTFTGKRIKVLKGINRSSVKRFDPDIKKGLTDNQIDERQQQGLVNKSTVKTTKSYFRIIFGNIFTFFNILCFIVIGALIAVGSWKNLAFSVIILANLLIGIIQEIKAKRTVEKITLVTAPIADVKRNGEKVQIPINQVVLDDVIYFNLGKQVCVDCIIKDGQVSVNESLLTGESETVKKKAGDILYSGSFITAGECTAIVEKVGYDCYSAKLTQKAKKFKNPKSDLLKALNLIITSIGIIIIPLSILTARNNYFQSNGNVVTTVTNTAGSIIGMIPAGMFLLTSVALAVGVIKLAKKRTLVQDLYGIEMLARTNVLCLDKTGTITDGSMVVKAVNALNGKKIDYVNDIMGSFQSVFGGNNQTSLALLNYFGTNTKYVPDDKLDFNSERKLSAVTFKNGLTYILGAPEMVNKKLDKELQKTIYTYLQKGYRVLLLAESKEKIDKDKAPKDNTPIALIVIEDNIRTDAIETIKWFNENAVEIKIISGDNPVTVSEISKRVGIIGADKYISMDGVSNEEIPSIVNKYTIFGRVSPDQKKWLVRALRKKGKKVAMTGDGVNDILALKEADCSIAMASGSEAARNVSNIVMLDSNFSSMPDIVAEGRRVINNISKSSSLFLMKTFFTIFITIFCLITRNLYPFTTNMLLLLETLVIGIPSFFLALQPNNTPIQGTFMSKLIITALPAAITLTVNVLLCYAFNLFVPLTKTQLETMCSLIVILSGFIILFKICKPFDTYKSVLSACMFGAFILAMIFIPKGFFGYSVLSLQNVFYIIILSLLTYHIYSFLIYLCNQLWYNKDEFLKRIKNVGRKPDEDDDDIDFTINNKNATPEKTETKQDE